MIVACLAVNKSFPCGLLEYAYKGLPGVPLRVGAVRW